MYKSLVLLVSFILLSACVPHKELVYMQQGNAETGLHPNLIAPYRVQLYDLLTLSIRSFDPKLISIFNNAADAYHTSASSNNEQNLYANSYGVDEKGRLRLPLIGYLEVVGKTTEEIAQQIEAALLQAHYTQDAGLFVTVKLAGFRFVVTGEVQLPGTHVMYQDKVGLLEALAKAGDITMTGNRKEVLLIRQLPTGAQTYLIDLTAKALLQSPHYYIQPNDVIYVKPLPQKSWGTGRTGIESLTAVLSFLALITTTLVLLKK